MDSAEHHLDGINTHRRREVFSVIINLGNIELSKGQEVSLREDFARAFNWLTYIFNPHERAIVCSVFQIRLATELCFIE